MNEQEKIALNTQIQDTLIDRQNAHFDALDALGRTFGLDLDVYKEIYGSESFDASVPEAQALLGKWQLLTAALTGPERYTLLVGTRQELKPGCYGFGAEAQYRTIAKLVLIDGDARISTTKDEESNTSFILSGDAIHIIDSSLEPAKTATLATNQDYSISKMLGNTGVQRLMQPNSLITSAETISDLIVPMSQFYRDGSFLLSIYNVLNPLLRQEMTTQQI